MRTLFSTAGKSAAEAWSCWSAMSSREFYDGDLEAGPAVIPDFTFEKALEYPISLTHLVCRAPIGYRRSWQHIRNDRAGLRVIWFVKRGELRFARSRGDFQILAGQGGIVDSNVPFGGRIVCDAESVFESIQAIVPAHLFLGCLPDAERFSGSFDLSGPGGQLVGPLLELLWSKGEQLAPRTLRPLVEALLHAVADSIGAAPSPHRRPSIVDKRLADIENYILMHLTDPNLCSSRVAASCGISPRYLGYVLKANNTSFSEFLWKNRLPRARDRLVSAGSFECSIGEVAFMSGFKSAAHFCRMFKSTYGCTPREYRAAHGPAARPADSLAH